MNYRIGYVMMPFGFDWRPMPIVVPYDAAREKAKAARAYAEQAGRDKSQDRFAALAGLGSACPCCGHRGPLQGS